MRPRYHLFVAGVIKGTKKRGETEIVSSVKIKTNQSTKQITQVQKIRKIDQLFFYNRRHYTSPIVCYK